MARRSKKKLKSWQRRRIRRTKMIIGAVLFCVLIIALILLVNAAKPYERVDLTEYCICTYSGYNTKGSVEVTVDESKLSELMRSLKTKYEDSFIHFSKCEAEDYNAFYRSISVTLTSPQYLSNGSKFSYTVNYDKQLAKKLRLKVKSDRKEVMASGLVTAAVISQDQVFEGISFVYEGVSPNITATMVNNTTNPYLSDVTFNIEGEKETYTEGDVIRVRATYDEAVALEKHFVIDCSSTECYRDYVVEASSHYIRSKEELPQSVIKEAVASANTAFTTKSAKEFGVRVFIESGVAPIYINKESTFEWASYNPVSAYLKIANADVAGKNSNTYNDLDVCYTCVMKQANGEAINLEAVVRFSNIVVNNDGTLSYDFSKPTIIAASHMDSRIKKTVIGNYEKDHTIDKLSVK